MTKDDPEGSRPDKTEGIYVEVLSEREFPLREILIGREKRSAVFCMIRTERP